MPKFLRHEAEQNLGALHVERDRICRKLEEESSFFMAAPASPRSARRFNLIYKLLQHQVQMRADEIYGGLDRRLLAMDNIQKAVGEIDEDEDLRKLVISVTDGKLMEETIGIVERGVRAMRQLNGRDARLYPSTATLPHSSPGSNASMSEILADGDGRRTRLNSAGSVRDSHDDDDVRGPTSGDGRDRSYCVRRENERSGGPEAAAAGGGVAAAGGAGGGGRRASDESGGRERVERRGELPQRRHGDSNVDKSGNFSRKERFFSRGNAIEGESSQRESGAPAAFQRSTPYPRPFRPRPVFRLEPPIISATRATTVGNALPAARERGTDSHKDPVRAPARRQPDIANGSATCSSRSSPGGENARFDRSPAPAAWELGATRPSATRDARGWRSSLNRTRRAEECIPRRHRGEDGRAAQRVEPGAGGGKPYPSPSQGWPEGRRSGNRADRVGEWVRGDAGNGKAIMHAKRARVDAGSDDVVELRW